MSVEPAMRRGIGGGALGRQPDSLADVLERVLDKGIVIAGDVVVNILDIELLTLKLRLFISSADTARQMGMDWWSRDPFFSGRAVEGADASDTTEVEALRERVAALEALLRRQGIEAPAEGSARPVEAARAAGGTAAPSAPAEEQERRP
ncbi:gas vesicle protein [Geodermatophilus sp. SYSU D00703]